MLEVNKWKMESYLTAGEATSFLAVEGQLIHCFHDSGHSIYDTKTGVWSKSFSAPDNYPSQCCICNGKMYLHVTNQKSGIHSLWAYDFDEQLWENKGVMPSQSDTLPPFRVVGNKIYILNKAYDTESNTWGTLSSPPSTTYLGRGSFHVVVGDKMYVVANDAYYKSNPIHIVIYDTTNDTWTMGASTDVGANYWFSGESVGHKIFLIGDSLGSDRKMLVYDTLTNTFSADIEFPVSSFNNPVQRTAVVGSTIYSLHNGFMISYDTNNSGGGDPEPGSEGSLVRLGITLSAGKTVQSSVSANLADNAAYIFSTENPAVATVGTNGLVRGVAPGATRLKAVKSDEDFTESMPVRVTEGATDPDPSADGNGQYFLFVEKDDGGKMHFHAREISECDC